MLWPSELKQSLRFKRCIEATGVGNIWLEAITLSCLSRSMTDCKQNRRNFRSVGKSSLRQGLSLRSKMGLNTSASGCRVTMKCVMVTVSKSGRTVLDTKVTGSLTKHVDKAHFGTCMVTNTKVSGSMIKHTDEEYTHMQTVQGMKASGRMIYSMEKESRLG